MKLQRVQPDDKPSLRVILVNIQPQGGGSGGQACITDNERRAACDGGRLDLSVLEYLKPSGGINSPGGIILPSRADKQAACPAVMKPEGHVLIAESGLVRIRPKKFVRD